MLTIRLDKPITDLTLPLLRRDKLLEGDKGGILHLVDFANRYSWSGGAPVNGATIKDVAEKGNATFYLDAGQAVGFSGNGVDFSALTNHGAWSQIPARVAASIWGDGAQAQYFLMCMYVRLPTEADFNSGSTLVPMMTFSPGAGQGYQTGPEIAVIGQAINKSLTFRRQKALNTAESKNLVIQAGEFGKFAQVAMWRDATGQHCSVKTQDGGLRSSVFAEGVSTNNTVNFSAAVGGVGQAKAFGPAGDLTAYNWKLYRHFVENLRISGRNATDVLEADWLRTVSRSVFS